MLKAATAWPPAATATAQQRRFRRFRHEYNEERPHEALGDRVPAQVYDASSRPYPRTLPPLDYAGHFEVRRVYDNGCLWWRQRILFLSEALVGQDVAFEEVADGVWTVYFGTVALARFDERAHRLHQLGSDD